MTKDLMPEGEDLRKAIRWISGQKTAQPEKTLQNFATEAILRFDLSPRDEMLLLNFLKSADTGNEG